GLVVLVEYAAGVGIELVRGVKQYNHRPVSEQRLLELLGGWSAAVVGDIAPGRGSIRPRYFLLEHAGLAGVRVLFQAGSAVLQKKLERRARLCSLVVLVIIQDRLRRHPGAGPLAVANQVAALQRFNGGIGPAVAASLAMGLGNAVEIAPVEGRRCGLRKG